MATDQILLVCPDKVNINKPVFISHTFAVLSQDPVTTLLLSLLMAKDIIPYVCPDNVYIN